MPTPHSPLQNFLLGSLPQHDYTRLQPHLELFPLPLGWAVCEAGGKLGHVYFPTTSIVSLLYITEDGASAEIAITGNDGLVGFPILMGGDTTPIRASVASAGYAYRIKADIFRREMSQGGPLKQLALLYMQALITQMSQTAVCNRHHTLDQQLCRRLLTNLDRLPSNQLDMTQELIANMLGVRREGVTEAAGKLQEAGLIKYSRGRITVIDRERLEQRACECYSVVKLEVERLMQSREKLFEDTADAAMPAVAL